MTQNDDDTRRKRRHADDEPETQAPDEGAEADGLDPSAATEDETDGPEVVGASCDAGVETSDETAAGSRDPAGREVATLREELDRERQRTGEVREQLIRTAADFENFRKRTDRDRLDERKQAASGLVRDLLPVLDGLGRALSSAGDTEANRELGTFVAGVRMIEAQLRESLKQAGLERVDTSGIFDPMYHEALMQEPCEDKPHLSVLQVFEEGYRFGGRLLRPARVKVAHNPGGVSQPDEEGSAQGAASSESDE